MTTTSDIPVTGKAEFHITYRCDLSCLGCSRASWLKGPHTEDMTLDDAREFFRQADEPSVSWKTRPRKHEERPRIILVGGEPTLHPDFLEFVRLCTEWSQTYVQVLSNGHTAKARALCDEACKRFGASIHRDSWKTQSVAASEDYGAADWWWASYVSPEDAGLPSPPCYAHSSQVCGLSVDHEGYAVCTIGASMRALRGLPRTKRLADLFDPEIAARMTQEECSHCGYEYSKRGIDSSLVKRFETYAAEQPMSAHGARMSPTWQAAFEGRIAKPNLPYKHLPVIIG